MPAPRRLLPLAAAVLALSLAACSGGTEPQQPPGPRPTSTPASSSASDDADAAAGSSTPSAASTETSEPPAATTRPIRLAFAGDIHFEANLAQRLADDPRTALGRFARSTLSRADLAVVNLETAVTTRGTEQPKRFHFRAPSTAFEALAGAGIDVATMANNHSLDYGVVGLRDSIAAAKASDFPIVGIGADEDAAFSARRFTVKGQRVAIVGVTNVIDEILEDSWSAGPDKPGVAWAERFDRLRQAVADAREASDLVVVFLHWSREGDDCPTPASRFLERLLVKAGADIIVGSHTHIQLGNGWDPAGPYVDYGLGNFAFYASGGGPTTETGVLELTVRGRRVTDSRWVPARIENGVPVAQTGSAGRRIVDHKAALRSCTDLRSSPPD